MNIFQAKWIAENFGPTIKSKPEFENIQIITLDDQRFTIPLWISVVIIIDIYIKQLIT